MICAGQGSQPAPSGLGAGLYHNSPFTQHSNSGLLYPGWDFNSEQMGE